MGGAAALGFLPVLERGVGLPCRDPTTVSTRRPPQRAECQLMAALGLDGQGEQGRQDNQSCLQQKASIHGLREDRSGGPQAHL